MSALYQKGFLPLVNQRKAIVTSTVRPESSQYAFHFQKRIRDDSSVTQQSSDMTKSAVTFDRAAKHPLCRLVEGRMLPIDLQRLSGADRGKVRQRLGSLQQLASVPYVADASVRAATDTLVSNLCLRRHDPNAVTSASKLVGAYLAWLAATSSDSTAELSFCRMPSGSTSSAPSTEVGATVLRALLVIRTSVYAMAINSHAGNRDQVDTYVALLLSVVVRALAEGAMPYVQPLFSPSTRSNPTTSGKVNQECSEALKAWLATAHCVLNSFELLQKPHALPPDTLTPLQVATSVFERLHVSSRDTEGLVSVLRVACAADIIHHSRTWAVVGDTYADLLRLASPPSAKDSPLTILVSSDRQPANAIVLGLPASTHRRAFQTMATRAPLSQFQSWLAVAEGYFGDKGLPQDLRGQVLLATAGCKRQISPPTRVSSQEILAECSI